MSFDINRFARASVGLNTGKVTAGGSVYNGPAIFTYESAADAAATIEAANYFADVVYKLAVGDLIFANGNDAFTARKVSALDREAGTVSTVSIGLSDSIGTANLQDNAVTLAKMAGGTAGNLLTYDAAGDPAYVVTGTAGQVLTSNGAGAAPTMQTLAVNMASEVAGILGVANGGTGASSLTDGGILLGSGAGAVTAMAVLAAGEFVIGDGTTDPNAHALSGDVTCSSGGSVTIANDAVTTVKILDANVTTAKLAANAVTNAKISTDVIQTATVDLTASEVKNLAATQKELVAAPGAGYALQFLGASLILNYGTVQFTESGYNLAVRYTDGSGVVVSDAIETTGFIDQAADTLTSAVPIKDAIVAASGAENKALVLDNTGGGEIGAGDSTLRVVVAYKVVATGL